MALDNQIDDCSVLGLLADENNVWIITNKKVLQYNIYQKVCMNYATSDGNIWVDVFRYRAISRDRQGGLYVGGHRGFIHIQSGSVLNWRIRYRFSPVVTDVKLKIKVYSLLKMNHFIPSTGFLWPPIQKYRNNFFHRLSIH
mgnify:CR=1 FL=1